MEITVYVWYFNGWALVPFSGANVGHASLKIQKGDAAKGAADYDYEYLSWWPTSDPLNPFASYEHDRPVRYGNREKRSFGTLKTHTDKDLAWGQSDKEREGGKGADAKYCFSKTVLKCAEMLDFIRGLVSGTVTVSRLAKAGTWDTIYQNCSSTVAHCLRAGGADEYVSWPGYNPWQPTVVSYYCNGLVEAINRKHPGGAMKFHRADAGVALPEPNTGAPGLN